MKKPFFLIALFLLNHTVLFGQTPHLAQIEPLIDNPAQEAFYPLVTADGQTIFFTHADYKGIYEFNRSTKTIRTITTENGAGYGFRLTSDSQAILFRSFELRKGRRFYSLKTSDLKTGKTAVLEKNQRTLSTPLNSTDGSIVYIKNRTFKNTAKNKNSNQSGQSVFIQNRHLVLGNASGETILDPLGKGIYIWPSFSPDGSQIVFTLAGKGSFVCDLKGTIVSELGYINAPKWSPEGKWILGMQDYDDGRQITASELILISADGSQKVQLTSTTDRIELYPVWGATNSEILFSTDSGVLYRANLIIH